MHVVSSRPNLKNDFDFVIMHFVFFIEKTHILPTQPDHRNRHAACPQ